MHTGHTVLPHSSIFETWFGTWTGIAQGNRSGLALATAARMCLVLGPHLATMAPENEAWHIMFGSSSPATSMDLRHAARNVCMWEVHRTKFPHLPGDFLLATRAALACCERTTRCECTVASRDVRIDPLSSNSRA